MIKWFSTWLGHKKEKAQVELSDVEQRKKKYDVWAAFAKALLVFMLSFGAVGGFLSAYGMNYNRILCGAGIFALALLLSLIYETGKRWFTNLCVIGIFIIYAYMAVSRFWILNSGAYAVINEVYEQAQNYLGIVGGGLYDLRVDDSYLTISAIAFFVGVVFDILLVLRLQYKASLVRTVIMTFTAYLVPIYFDATPKLIYVFFLLSGYVGIAILQFGGVKEHISAQIRQVLPVAMAIAAAVTLLVWMLMPKVTYHTIVHKNVSKAASENSAAMYAQYGVMALFMNRNAGGGLNSGRLSINASVMHDNEPDLLVRYAPYSMQPVYLKSFTGQKYDGSRWSNVTEDQELQRLLLENMEKTVEARRSLYGENPELQSRGVMDVYWMDYALSSLFMPYYTDQSETARAAEELGVGARYVYYPMISDADLTGVEDESASQYLEVPGICYSAVERACRNAGLSGTPEQIASQIFWYFSTEYSYTLRPGYYFGGMDYISYFLDRNKKGFCTHFASAGTMLFRYMGIPARYVEGYVFTYTDLVTDGVIKEDEAYEDYYDGYNPLGKTALVELEVPDANAHAWIEIYLPEKGWVVVDVTPAADQEEEETASFWEAMMNGNMQNQGNAQQTQEAMEYVETALERSLWIFGVLLAGVMVFFLGRWGYGIYLETKLPGLQRVQLEYARLTKPLKEREDFAKLTTPREELDWIREHYAPELQESFLDEIYQTFFAPPRERDYESLRKRLKELRRKCGKEKKR